MYLEEGPGPGGREPGETGTPSEGETTSRGRGEEEAGAGQATELGRPQGAEPGLGESKPPPLSPPLPDSPQPARPLSFLRPFFFLSCHFHSTHPPPGQTSALPDPGSFPLSLQLLASAPAPGSAVPPTTCRGSNVPETQESGFPSSFPCLRDSSPELQPRPRLSRPPPPSQRSQHPLPGLWEFKARPRTLPPSRRTTFEDPLVGRQWGSVYSIFIPQELLRAKGLPGPLPGLSKLSSREPALGSPTSVPRGPPSPPAPL
ncbi:uncharacterized protein LOC130459057 [Monodelphis domestica]|uniref:uncharacterized protein LOC130459057 n=1 Tax=Monodelphis domestica TaxID=13616 RepID=UPI0024E2396F|nr:uncharacterized protein LOC130459057 [Monodelphis domestica]